MRSHFGDRRIGLRAGDGGLAAPTTRFRRRSHDEQESFP